MRESTDIQVLIFFNEHRELLERLSRGDGTSLGLYFGLVPNPDKTPIPCFASWLLPQMYETTPNLQQCVKTTITAGREYFFIITENIGDMHSMIYIHQTPSSLCIHRMDENVAEDELNICAENLAEMSLMQDAVEMYVCTNYLKQEGKLRIQVTLWLGIANDRNPIGSIILLKINFFSKIMLPIGVHIKYTYNFHLDTDVYLFLLVNNTR